jgi:hypothetical protein
MMVNFAVTATTWRAVEATPADLPGTGDVLIVGTDAGMR